MGKAIENAADVIEAFGGIRPMAKKMDVAVTTVQGWKKRNAIPMARKDEILRAAADHDVDLDGLLDIGSVANQNATSEKLDNNGDVVSSDEFSKPVRVVDDAAPSDSEIADLKQKIAMMEQQSQSKTLLVNVGVASIVVLALLGLAFLYFMPKETDEAELARLQALEAEISEVKQEQSSFLGAIIPQDLVTQIDDLKAQAEQAQETLGAVKERAQAIQEDVLSENAGDLEERLIRLETHLEDLTGSPVLAGLLDKYQTMQQDQAGLAQLSRSVQELQGVLAGLQTADLDVDLGGALDAGLEGSVVPLDLPLDLNAALDAARQQSDVLGQAFENVPQQDLKAAALLLGMTQFRSTLNRDNAAFESDLAVLQQLIGAEDSGLNDALLRLAPHAQSGVLTPGGLTNEFRTLAGDAVVASLQGDDVSLQERTQARLNELFAVEKDGELITGTDTQATLVRAEKLLEAGDVQAAIENVQALDGEAASVLQPWLAQAELTMAAQKVRELLAQGIESSAYGAGAANVGGALVGPGGSRLYQDKDSGVNVYVPAGNAQKNLYE